MLAFARRPSLYVQLSGLPFLYGGQWRGREAQSLLDEALDILGPSRLMFASDWPMLLRFATYADWVRNVDTLLDARKLAPRERDAIFAGNALAANPRITRRPAMRDAAARAAST